MSELNLESFSASYSELWGELASREKTLLPPEFALHVQSPDVAERMYRITEKLSENAKKFNLTSILEPSEIIRKHIIDSIIPFGILCGRGTIASGKKTTLVDIGCGAGFPLLPMAAVSEDYFPMELTGVDSTSKKIAHIRESADYVPLKNVSAVAGRAEELAAGKMRESFCISVARAVAALPVLLELCAPFVGVGGVFCAMKSHAEGEIASAGEAHSRLGMELREKIGYEIPGGDARVLLIYEKVAPTPRKYPRRYAEITKQPLK